MLYPKMNQARTVIDLSGVWEFKLGTDAEPGERIDRLEIPEVIAVPASYNDQKDESLGLGLLSERNRGARVHERREEGAAL